MAQVGWFQHSQNRRDFLEFRRRCRTDLLFLCNKCLGWPRHFLDVVPEVHGPVIDLLQKFDDCQGKDRVTPDGRSWYEPVNREPSIVLPAGPRRRLILDPRAHLKTTINVVAHSIQWILNFPDVSILIIHAVEQKANDILTVLREQFTRNPKFRHYFREYVPWGKAQERKFLAGNNFTVLNRQAVGEKEPTVVVGSLDKSLASGHWHVIKLTDIAEDTNMKTEYSRANVQNKVDGCVFLLKDPNHWIDMEGTRYHFNDPYGSEVRRWLNGNREWRVHMRSCYKKLMPKGAKHTPDYMDAPYETDEHGKRIPLWPKDAEGRVRFTNEVLENMKDKNPSLFAAQMLNNPAEDESQERPFPSQNIRWIDPKDLERVPIQFKVLTVDTASTINVHSNSSVITCGMWDRNGRIYVPEIRCDKMLPSKFFDNLFDMWDRYRPQIIAIEDTEYTKGLQPAFENECRIRGKWPHLYKIKRSTHVRKHDRIQRAFQPVFNVGSIRFSKAIDDHIKERLQRECDEFRMSDYDDILDTLADLVQFSAWSRKAPRESEKATLSKVNNDITRRAQQQWLSEGIYYQQAPPPDERGEEWFI